ncbi:MAG: SDR family NAD(P)-dependent oxidoreductase [Hyphomonadaceae bacterium]
MADAPLAGRCALVTGGRGIGAGIAACLARDGADVAIVFRQDRAAAEATAAVVEGFERRAVLVQADLRERAQCTRAAQEAADALGRIDILVANAGSATRGDLVVDTREAEFADAFAVHCLAAVWLSQALVPAMRDRGRGDVCVVTSAIPVGGGPRIGPYHMAKAAAEAFVHTLAHEERVHGIRVNAIRPGFTETDMGRRLTKAMTGAADLRAWDAAAPFGRVEQPEDIGNMIAFLCSDHGAYVTNQIICVDGGQATIGGAPDAMARSVRT